MDEGTRRAKIEEAVGLFRQAQDVLLSQLPATSTALDNNRENNFRYNRTMTSTNPISDTVALARSMMQSSSSAGLYRRLNRNERLRASGSVSGLPASTSGSRSSKEKKERKPFEFALRTNSNDDGGGDSLRRDMILERGVVTLTDGDNEQAIRGKLRSALKGKYSHIGTDDFDFIKVSQKKISPIHLGTGTEYNYHVVKKIAGQGQLYIQVKETAQFVCDGFPQSDSDDDLLNSNPFLFKKEEQKTTPEKVDLSKPNENCSKVLDVESKKTKIDDVNTAKFIKIAEDMPEAISDPTEILRYLQKKVVTGRELEVTNSGIELIGDTNYIIVDRQNILSTTMEELRSVDDPRKTFQVDFYGEQAVDSGGPRKEWIRLCNREISTKYFEHGLKEHLSEDYYFVGQLAASAFLQNGQVPKYFPPDTLHEILVSDTNTDSHCLRELWKGVDTLGMRIFFKKFPLLMELFTSAPKLLTVKSLINLLAPSFSEEGSNSYCFEKAIYAKFIKYIRETAAGRRCVKLEDVLIFVTGASEEPVLGFQMHPSITFVPSELTPCSQPDANGPIAKSRIMADFTPKAMTCDNSLHLPRATVSVEIPDDNLLFNCYDLAFANSYFGKM